MYKLKLYFPLQVPLTRDPQSPEFYSKTPSGETTFPPDKSPVSYYELIILVEVYQTLQLTFDIVFLL